MILFCVFELFNLKIMDFNDRIIKNLDYSDILLDENEDDFN